MVERWQDVATDQAVQCLRLHLVHGVGPYRFRALVDHFGSVEVVLGASQDALARVPNVGPKTSAAIDHGRDESFLRAELKQAGKLGARIICQADEEYPALLREIPDAPVCLYVLGHLVPQDKTALAVVGSRRCSHYGAEQAYQFGMALARTGLTVISGLARGVDAQAHLGALDCRGRTIAVLGSGLGHMAKHQNARLAQRIVETAGAVISELAIAQPPHAQHFPVRNRIIASLGLGTLVVEAAQRSGALITARQTLDYNRELFALPGRVDNPYAAGPLSLIRDGRAKLTARLEDILEELGHAAGGIRENFEDRSQNTMALVAENLSEDERLLLDSLDREGVSLEHVCQQTKLPPQRISSGLMTLQLKGVVEQLPGNRFAKLL